MSRERLTNSTTDKKQVLLKKFPLQSKQRDALNEIFSFLFRDEKETYHACINLEEFEEFVVLHQNDSLLDKLKNILNEFKNVPQFLSVENFKYILYILEYVYHFPSSTGNPDSFQKDIQESIKKNDVKKYLAERFGSIKKIMTSMEKLKPLISEIELFWSKLCAAETKHMLYKQKGNGKVAGNSSYETMKETLSNFIEQPNKKDRVPNLFKNVQSVLKEKHLFQINSLTLLRKLDAALDTFICQQYFIVSEKSAQYLVKLNNHASETKSSSHQEEDFTGNGSSAREFAAFPVENSETDESDDDSGNDFQEEERIVVIQQLRKEIQLLFKNSLALQDNGFEKHTGLRLMAAKETQALPDIQFYKKLRQTAIDRDAAGKSWFGHFRHRANRDQEIHLFYEELIKTPLMIQDSSQTKFLFNHEKLQEFVSLLQNLNESLQERKKQQEANMALAYQFGCRGIG